MERKILGPNVYDMKTQMISTNILEGSERWREICKEGGKEGGREGEKEGGREGRREGRMERRKDGGREGGTEELKIKTEGRGNI